MRTVTVAHLFADLREHVDRHPGDVFEVTDERAKEILSKLPDGYVTVSEPEAPDYGSMTVEELKALCAERGIDVPRRVSKARLVSALEG